MVFGLAPNAILNLQVKLINLHKMFCKMYKCFGCGHELTKEEVDRRIICPYCGSRIIVKTRPGTLKKVKAR